jgi:uncharacterized protein
MSERVEALELALREHLRAEEARYAGNRPAPDTLWEHASRVARIAERLGRAERLDPLECRLAALFHDAGKFESGHYHEDGRPEEERSVELLREMGRAHGLDEARLATIGKAVLQLYRDDPDPLPLTRVLFDADNLDKLGPLGVANGFIKAGLRGSPLGPRLLPRLTVELTYARHAPGAMHTSLGREWAGRRAAQTIAFIESLLASLREDGLYDFRVEPVDFEGVRLDVVAPVACACGGRFARRVWQEPGLKCTEIHIEHACTACGERGDVRLCRSRLLDPGGRGRQEAQGPAADRVPPPPGCEEALGRVAARRALCREPGEVPRLPAPRSADEPRAHARKARRPRGGSRGS